MRNAERVKHGDRCQKPDQMAKEDHEHTDMEQDRTHHQLAAAQQLA